MKEFKLPELGENILTADVLNVLVKPGDYVKKEQPVLEIETDKATIEVPSEIEGTVKEVFVKAGDKAEVGKAVFSVEETSSTEVKKESAPIEQKIEEKVEVKKEEKKETPQTKSGGVIEIRIPDLGENITTADILNVLVKAGDSIKKDQGILEIETDKATIEVPSEVNGTVKEVLMKAGDKAKIGDVIMKVETSETVSTVVTEKPVEKKEETKVEEKQTSVAANNSVDNKILTANYSTANQTFNINVAPAAPSVRRLARELGVDVNKIPGSGPNGRISIEDVKAYVKKLNIERSSGGEGLSIKQQDLPDFSKFGSVEVKEMSNIRSKTAEHLSYAWATIPHVTQFDKADITELEKARKQLSSKLEKEGAKLTVTAILVKIITAALKVYPQFNASVDMKNKSIVYKKYYNIGIAVDTEHGLIVPNIKNADKKNIKEIIFDLNNLAEKARARKISLDDIQGGCFSISNLGGIGGTSFTPIVNSPEVAILGVSRGSYEPVFNGENFEPRLMLPLSLSYDHRLIDGADAARFLRWVCEALEQPLKVLIEG